MLKRSFDLLVAVFALLVLLPILGCIAILVAILLGPPILFRQERPGRNEDIFTLLKFRTMANGVGADGLAQPDAQRLTRFGRILRASSLDELPELINVIRGEMSLVGPRPLLPEYLPLYNEWQRRRHAVRPGITGWAQLNGRNAISWDEKFKLDVWYVENQSFMLDLKILALTVVSVLKREGINQIGHDTAERFTGNSG